MKLTSAVIAVDKSRGLQSDQTIVLANYCSTQALPTDSSGNMLRLDFSKKLTYNFAPITGKGQVR